MHKDSSDMNICQDRNKDKTFYARDLCEILFEIEENPDMWIKVLVYVLYVSITTFHKMDLIWSFMKYYIE
jgi:hypothetical protein